MPLLKEKAVLITGAGSGVSRATAVACAREGARVAAVDLDANASEETVRLVEKAGVEEVSNPGHVGGRRRRRDSQPCICHGNGRGLLLCYVASKHGVIGLTKAGALQYAPQGIRINAVCPGGIQTPMMESLPSEDREHITAMHPIGRLATACACLR